MRRNLVPYSVGLLVLIVAGAGALIGIGAVAAHAVNAYIASSLPSLREGSAPAHTEMQGDSMSPRMPGETDAEPQSRITSGQTDCDCSVRASETLADASSRATPRHVGTESSLHGQTSSVTELPPPHGDVHVDIAVNGQRVALRPVYTKQSADLGRAGVRLRVSRQRRLERVHTLEDELPLAAVTGRVNGISRVQERREQAVRFAERQREWQNHLQEKLQRLQRTARGNIHVAESKELL